MEEVGVRALKQNASAVVAAAAAGTPVIITDRGRPAALLTPLPGTRLARLVAAGLARPPRRPGGVSALPTAAPTPGPDLSGALAQARDSERY